MAAYLATKGFRVHLYNKTPERIAPVKARGGIELEAEGRSSFGRIPVVTTDMGEALQGADVVMVAVPASAQHSVAVRCAPHLRDDQIILLNPGRTGGHWSSMRLDRTGAEMWGSGVEAQTFIFASTLWDRRVEDLPIKNLCL